MKPEQPKPTLRQHCVKAVVDAGGVASTVVIVARVGLGSTLVRRCVTSCVKDGLLERVRVDRSPTGGTTLVVKVTPKGLRALEVMGPQKPGVKPGSKKESVDGMGSGKCLLQEVWKGSR